MIIEKSNIFYKKLLVSMILTLSAVYMLYSVILTTLYSKVSTDIAFQIPILVDIVAYLPDICEIVGILIGYAFIIFAAYRFDKHRVMSFITWFVVLMIAKYILKIATSYVINGSLPIIDSLFSDLMYSFALPALLECMQLAIVILIIYFVIQKANAYIVEKKKIKQTLAEYQFEADSLFFPFTKMIDKNNPLQLITLRTSLVVLLSKMVQFIIIDISLGLPTNTSGWISILIAYTSCLLLGILSYLFIVWMLIFFHNNDLKYNKFN